MEINEMVDMNEGESIMGDVDDIFTGSFEAGMGENQVICGIAAMEKKCSSKPMQQILGRLARFEHIDVLVFPESTILHSPPESWPICDAFLSFYSSGFPLEKAIAYAKLRKPWLVNDLETQLLLQDRQKVHETLAAAGVELPRYAVLIRDPLRPDEANIVEHDDWIEIGGDQVFHKPFVEKPLSAEDHNVYIYYPSSAGGGSQRLFRKIGSRSSVYSSESRIRRQGSYIYEEFTPTDGTDVKVYTVGPDYAHAEARKSPALDGKVDRDADGKEIRYPVILSAREKIISRSIVLAFSQNVCGFDLLRTNGKTYVCDVNGFSFVKNSNKYYDDCAKILGNMIMRELGEKKGIPWANAIQIDEDCPIVPTTSGAMMELRCVTAVLRHGDRTPKQKMKMDIRHPKFFEIFAKYGGYSKGNVKLKHPTQLQEILDLTRFLLREMDEGGHHADNIEEKRGKLMQMVVVLELYGHFSGVYRKCILRFPKSSNNAGGSAPASMTNSTINTLCGSGSATSHFSSPMAQLQQQQILQQQQQQHASSISASGSTTQFAADGGQQPQQSASTRGSLPLSSADESTCSPNEEDDRPRLELVLKWGGELTPAGRIQAEELGKAFRKLYPDTTGSQNRHSESDEDVGGGGGGGGGGGEDDDDDGGWRFDEDEDDVAIAATSSSTVVEIGASGAIAVANSGSDSALSPSRRHQHQQQQESSTTRKIERRSSYPKCHHGSVSSQESLNANNDEEESVASPSAAAAAAVAAYRRGVSAPGTRRSKKKRRSRAKSDDAGDLGLGLLRLQSTFRHDLKIYASDEGRVQMTAAAFTKGLLDLEGELTPILVQMVKSANTNGLLDNDSQVARQQNVVKARLHSTLQKNEDFDAQDYEILARGGSLGSKSIYKAMKFVRNPTKMCERIANLIADMLDVIRTKKEDPKCHNDVLYHQESWDLMYRRWEKLKKDFKMKNGKYDISKVPDIYDCIKYDYQHNQRYLEFKRAQEFFTCSKALADLVIPLEYGISKEEKLDIGQGILTPLLRKIRMDFQRVIENDFDLDDCSRLDPRYSNYRYTRGIQSPYRHVRTRLYFTSESHIHSLLNVIQFGGLCDETVDPQWRRAMEYLSAVSELNYLTQIVIMLYEDPRQDPASDERFHIELHFSAGAITGILEKNIRSYSMEIGGNGVSSTSPAAAAAPTTVGGPLPNMKKCPTDPTDFAQRQQHQQPTSPMSEYLRARFSPVSPLSRSWDSKSPAPVLAAVSEETSTAASTPSTGSTSGSTKALEKQDSKDSASIVFASGRDQQNVGGNNNNNNGNPGASAVSAASFSTAFDLDDSPPASAREVDRRFHVVTLDSAKKKLACLANEKIEKPTSFYSSSSSSPRRKDDASVGGGGVAAAGSAGGGGALVIRGHQGRAASKSDADRHAAFLFSNEKNAPYATFHGVSNLSRMQPTTPWTSLFSTKLLTGSSSAPNLLDLDYVTAASLNEKLLTCGEGIPSIRPLETLHCSLSLRQLDRFMEKVTDPAFRNFSSSSTPQSSPPSSRGKSALSMASLATTSGQKPATTSISNTSAANFTASATCPQPIPTASSNVASMMIASTDDASMTSLTGSPVSFRDPMTSSLNSLANASSPRDSRSNSPTIVGPDLSFCSEGVVRLSAESANAAMTTATTTPMILDDEDSNTRDSMMQLEEIE